MALGDANNNWEDEQVNHLVRLRFDEQQFNKEMSKAACTLCGKKMLDDDHAITCERQRGFLIKRHDRVVRYLFKYIRAGKHPNAVSAK